MASPTDLQIAQPLTLKCGLTLPNRLVKAAMAEWLNDKETKLPSERLNSLSKHWAMGGWGMLITGNVEVDPRHTGSPEDVAVDPSLPIDSVLPAFTRWAESFKASNSFSDAVKKTPVLVQINHPGRQSPRGAGTRGFFGQTVAPSAVPINWGPGILPWFLRTVAFGTPRELTIPEIEEIVRNFAHTARVVAEAGFDGVQIHAAHGYLLSQFLSSATNKRTDKYGGSAERRAQVVIEVIEAVKEATREFRSKGFAVGIKVNSADYQSEGEVADVVKQFRMIAEAGVDFVEVSGGSYENPSMNLGLQNKSERTKAREAYFLEFASIARRELSGVPLLVTGGFTSRLGMENAVAQGDCELIGLGRPAVINPTLPNNTVFNKEVKDEDAKLYRRKNEPSWLIKLLGIRAVGAGADTAWYTKQIQVLASS